VLDFATNAARSVLGQIGAVEHRVEHLDSVGEKLHEAVDALHHHAEALDRHVEALEAVGEALPTLTEAVTRLCDQLSAALSLAAPLETAEREVSGLRRIFRLGRRRAAAPVAALPTPPPSAHAGGSGSAPR
jgi:hypothetical protein